MKQVDDRRERFSRMVQNGQCSQEISNSVEAFQLLPAIVHLSNQQVSIINQVSIHHGENTFPSPRLRWRVCAEVTGDGRESVAG